MARGLRVNKIIERQATQEVSASVTNSVVSDVFPITDGDSKVMSIMLDVSDALAATGITAKLQDSADGSTFRDAGSVSITDVNIQSSLVIEDITYTAVTAGTAGDNITIAYVDDGTAGSETVDVTDTDIVIHMEAGVSTATQVKAAYDAEAAAVALATAAITGTAGDAQAAHAEAPLAGGAEPNGVFEIVHNIYDTSADPLWGIGRIVVTTGSGDSVTITQIRKTTRG